MSIDRDMTEVREYQAGRTKMPKPSRAAGRPPDGKTARTEWLKLRITPEELAEIDRALAPEETRSAFVRAAVADRIRRVDQLTGKVKR